MKKITVLFLIIVLSGVCFADLCVSGNCLNGKGATISGNNTRYVGDFKGGTRNGTGVLTIPGVYEYTGDFKNGVFDGQGQLIWADGSVYSGGFKNGKYHGYGTFMSNMGVNIGQWENGLFVGK
jgi:hypothetical protein